ncbi:isoprenyl transferase [Pseudogracilibacillus auburnensis]|uniref:Isoprenyl transferase n=1 Tax=Pseudogracilibacillus auburnensis TaxID=1494959 RepID=A0A2V3W3V3_9BACI|nr:isoprenyl transferase [Pseudogracilibacillus auburnensis]MBO1003774.1 isoprenyl transferase [Pseudogracilibacillus auburnensis]PXW88640.1 undecaprenyl pyrophosphate synthetase [Pseudogracilibacillus auburnensis]
MSKWFSFFNSKQKVVEKTRLENVPNHIAIIMDGNGRWASKKGLPRIAGHKEGMTVVQKIVRAAVKHEVKILTLYAFSTENWKRPKPEVDFLMKLPKEFSHIYLPEMIENNVKIDTIGEFDKLPNHTKDAINHAKEKTKNNDGLLLNFALNYGSRYEIMRAIKHVALDLDNGKMNIENLNEEVFSNYLYTNKMQDPDLLIRTSGEQRLSNFLLWQLAYAEFWFTDVLWPDFNEEIFEQALFDYQSRKRRYGGI